MKTATATYVSSGSNIEHKRHLEAHSEQRPQGEVRVGKDAEHRPPSFFRPGSTPVAGLSEEPASEGCEPLRS
jgi:hypothetical protein